MMEKGTGDDKQYYACMFRLNGSEHYVLWYTDDPDGLVRESGRIRPFSSLKDLQAYARAQGFRLRSGAPTMYDWDWIHAWSMDPEPGKIDAAVLLDAWNMLADTRVADESTGLFAEADRRGGGLYDKLFRANKLPAITSSDVENYEPHWAPAEVKRLAHIFRIGIEMLRRELGEAAG
jgi:hypothetical protein